MSEFSISHSKESALLEKMSKFGIKEEDIVEKFIRSGGHGGQNVNKTSTCIYLKHIPTGIEVKCQKERSQVLNRYYARRILVDRIEEFILGKLSQKQQEIEKIRRQKRKRSRRAKLKILENKKKHSQKKSLRGTVRDDYS